MSTSPAPGSGRATAADAALAAALLCVDPAGLGGVALRSRAGPVRDRWMAQIAVLLPEGERMGRLPAGIGDDRLLGGLDLGATLAAGRPVVERGVLAAHDGRIVAAPMAERIDDGTASRIAAVLDAGEVVIERDGLSARAPARFGLILLDEGAEPEERPPAALLERLAFRVSLDGVALGDAVEGPAAEAVARGRAQLAQVAPVSPEIIEALCAAAASFGVESIRGPLLAVRAARARAALEGRDAVIEADAAAAVRLVLLPRALTLPTEAPRESEEEREADAADETPQPSAPSDEASDGPVADGAEVRVAAIQALLPDDLLERIVAENLRCARTPRRSGSGEAAKSARRGRPAGSRPGRLRPGDRLNLPETLRAAAPWQRLRAAAHPGETRLRVRLEDFRIRRFVQQRESTVIFVVDASGSAAVQRLAEAKGAVELLLAKAYVARDRVALVAFRGAGADILLPPTRSLTRAKRSLADLPGGGGTPLASGLDAALTLAMAERARDRTPLIVVLTDGRANIGRGGAPGRDAAERDALAACTRIGEARVRAAFLDTSSRPQAGGDRFARAMHGVYAPLPYAEAGRVSAIVDDLRGRG